MDVVVAPGLRGAEQARGLAIVIDVFRAFTVSAYALGGGARECILVREVSEALALQARIPGSMVSAEVDGLPVEGVPISNSPTMVAAVDWGGRTLIQRSSAGTQCATAAAAAADRVFAAGFVVAGATARLVRSLDPPLVTLVPTGAEGRHVEDLACATLLEALLTGGQAAPGELLEQVRADERYRFLSRSEVPGFPASDLELALQVDRFDFAQEARLEDGLLRLRAVAPATR